MAVADGEDRGFLEAFFGFVSTAGVLFLGAEAGTGVLLIRPADRFLVSLAFLRTTRGFEAEVANRKDCRTRMRVLSRTPLRRARRKYEEKIFCSGTGYLALMNLDIAGTETGVRGPVWSWEIASLIIAE